MLKIIDFIGPEPKLTIEKKSNFKSNFGGIMTLLIIFISLAALVGFGIDIIQKMKPRVTYNRIKNPQIPEFNLTDDNFFFTLYDQASDDPIPHIDRMFFVYYDYLSFEGNGKNSHKLKKPFYSCSQRIIDKWKTNFAYDPAGYYCLPENELLIMKGTGSTGAFKFLRISVDYCKNNTNSSKGPIKNDCYTKQETQNLLFNKRIQMNYMIQDSVINTFDFTYPASDIILSDFVNTDPYTWSRLVINFKKIQINTDKGFFIRDVETQFFTGIDSTKFENFYTPETDSVFSHALKFSDWMDVYERDYIKVQDTFAMMGGFINISLIIIKFLNSYITRTQIVDIFNKNYCFIDTKRIGVRDDKISVFSRKEV
jgi:hypothetical protein